MMFSTIRQNFNRTVVFRDNCLILRKIRPAVLKTKINRQKTEPVTAGAMTGSKPVLNKVVL